MKKHISFVLIGLMIIAGIILALPFTTFRKSMSILGSVNKTVEGVNSEIRSANNIVIAQTVNELILSADSYAEVKDIISGTGKSVVDNGSGGSGSSYSSTSDKIQSSQSFGDINVGANNPPLLVQSTNQSVTNAVTMDKTSYRMNMTSRSLVNNRNSRLMAMSGSNNSETSAAQSSVRQMAGGAPPPSEDEAVVVGTLPVGDGLNFMLLLMVLFGIFKIRKL